MITHEIINEIAVKSDSRIVVLVLDGLGGLPDPQTGKTELETALTPNMDLLAMRGMCGLVDPVAPGITPGSGPGHLGLFGYDPLTFVIGRGVIETLGVGFDLKSQDIAARGNFCTVDSQGIITDRRAGPIPTDLCRKLTALLNEIRLPGIQAFVMPVQDYRFALVLRGDRLSPNVRDTDPEMTGVPPKVAAPTVEDGGFTSDLVNMFIKESARILASHYPANMVMLRGFSRLPTWPSMKELFKLSPAAVVDYPMYRGISRLLGMEILATGSTIEDEFATLSARFTEHDFFFVHIKKTDSAGEDGNFAAKVGVIEEVDRNLPSLLALKPDVLVITGDHSTPALLKGHSWHSVPLVLYSKWCRPDGFSKFSERTCSQGGLGRMRAVDVMSLAMAHAMKLIKFGA